MFPIDTLIAELTARGFQPEPYNRTVKRDVNSEGFVVVSGETNLTQVYVALHKHKGGSVARWCALDADAIEAFIARAERMLTEWDSMEVTFNAPVNA